MGKFQDLTGMRFGRLLVLRRANKEEIGNRKGHGVYWLCECQCEKKTLKVVAGGDLKAGKVVSCGCYHDEASRQRGYERRKQNQYILSQEFGIGFTNNNNKKFYFDLEDYNLINKYNWCEHHGYLETQYYKKRLYFHRLVMGVADKSPKEIIVDHINHNKLDNRKQNLRLTNQKHNCMNQVKAINNTSGVTGVHYDKKSDLWIARLRRNYDGFVYRETFNNFEDAVKARKIAEEKYFKEYSYDNSMKLSEDFKINEQ